MVIGISPPAAGADDDGREGAGDVEAAGVVDAGSDVPVDAGADDAPDGGALRDPGLPEDVDSSAAGAVELEGSPAEQAAKANMPARARPIAGRR
ncbi:hypothetical protein [Arthrobacter sp.]|uniref:hypothetical protein n=1 Tax=Arthrobacter sp. TaxID=1667 RepID=UPI003A9471D7